MGFRFDRVGNGDGADQRPVDSAQNNRLAHPFQFDHFRLDFFTHVQSIPSDPLAIPNQDPLPKQQIQLFFTKFNI